VQVEGCEFETKIKSFSTTGDFRGKLLERKIRFENWDANPEGDESIC